MSSVLVAISIAVSFVALLGFGAMLWVVVQIVGQNGRLLQRFETLETAGFIPSGATTVPSTGEGHQPPYPGLTVGSMAPDFVLPGLYGETLTLRALRAAGKPVLLVFSDPDSAPCNLVLSNLGRRQAELTSVLTIAVISRGDPHVHIEKRDEHGTFTVLLRQNDEVLDAYRVADVPSAVAIDAAGWVASQVAQGMDEISALVTRFLGGDAVQPDIEDDPGDELDAAPAVSLPEGLPVGTPAPTFSLPDLHGNQVQSEEYRNGPTLLLFWRPDCGFCRRMLDDLKAWEEEPEPGAPHLLVVATGLVEDIMAQGFRSTVLIDQEFSTARAFGAEGTPSAVLIDAGGAIASPLAIGGPAVLALASTSGTADHQPSNATR